MTILEGYGHPADRVADFPAGPRMARRRVVRPAPVRPDGAYRGHQDSRRLPSVRPPVGPIHYRGSGRAVSTAPHRVSAGARVGNAVTVAVAGLAALITVWLGLIAQAGADRAQQPAAGAERLTVVQVRTGETLQQLAGRLAPDAPAAEFADRIRDLNALHSSAVEAGRTLIAPIG